MHHLDLVLYQPSIPGNTGNIGRLCVGMGARLHLIKPCGFSLDEKQLRRAGLDYWPHLSLQEHDSTEAFLEWIGDREPWLVTKFGAHRFDQAPYQRDDIIIMGNEQKGLPAAWRERWAHRCVAVPMFGPIRSYNLANTTGIVLAQALAHMGALDAWRPGDGLI